jgi:hypothetical protein
MAEKFFDPSEIIRGIRHLLESDKKKIAFLFGAGTSLARKNEDSPSIPAIGKMTELVIEHLKKATDNGKRYNIALTEIKEELEQQGQSFNIETLLSNVEEKVRIIGKGTLNNLNKEEFVAIGNKIREKIREIISVHKNLVHIEKDLIQYDFAKWIANANRKIGVEIFTTNYDYLFEIGLEVNNVPYYDGFTGSYEPFFNADSLEDEDYLPTQTKLWKIHGSLGLQKKRDGRILRLNSDSEGLLIYPSSLKYSDSKKQPYLAFMDRLNLFLKQDDSVLFVCGYSFGDEHINERLLSALRTNTTAHVFVLNYDIEWQKDEDGADVRMHSFSEDSIVGKIASCNRKISVLATRAAIMGGQFGEWKIKPDIDTDDLFSPIAYFREDVSHTKEPETGEQIDEQIKTGKGELLLPNFVSFVELLKSMIPKSEWEGNSGE